MSIVCVKKEQRTLLEHLEPETLWRRAEETGVAQFFDWPEATPAQRIKLRGWLQARGHRVVMLRPTTPWDPAAPFRHLCASVGHSLPTLSPTPMSWTMAWLGPQVFHIPFFDQVAKCLRDTPLVAFVAVEEGAGRSFSLWQSFLLWVMHHQVNAPLTLVHILSAKQPPAPGRRLPESVQAFVQDLPEPALPAWLERPIPRWVQSYVPQLLFVGDHVNIRAVRRISRAQHVKRIGQLKQMGWIDEEGDFDPEVLHMLSLGSVPQSESWWRKAMRLLRDGGLFDDMRAFWLEVCHPGAKQGKASSRALWSGAFLQLSPEQWLSQLGTLQGARLSPEEQWSAYLLASRMLPDPLQEEALARWELPAPWETLRRARMAFQTPTEGPQLLQRCREVLEEEGMLQMAGMVALEEARWQLLQKRPRLAIALLKMHEEADDWVLAWLRHILWAQAFLQMGRLDMVQHKMQQAVNVLPGHTSRALVSELRLLSAAIFDKKGLPQEADIQIDEATQLCRSSGDGARLALVLGFSAERLWRQGRLEQARGLYSQVLALARHSHDLLAARDAQIKLGLVIREVPFERFAS